MNRLRLDMDRRFATHTNQMSAMMTEMRIAFRNLEGRIPALPPPSSPSRRREAPPPPSTPGVPGSESMRRGHPATDRSRSRTGPRRSRRSVN